MRRLLLVLIAIAFVPLQGAVARATDVQGTFTVGPPNVISVTPDDDECIIVLDEAFFPVGDLQGTMNSHFRIEHMGPCGQPAPETFEARGTFTGSVLGKTGSFATPSKGQSTLRVTRKEYWKSSGEPVLEGWLACVARSTSWA